jgi:MFS family permease
MPWPHPLRALRHPNLRRFFAGQSVSLVGSWMQQVAQGWLVYRLTRSSGMLGLVSFLAQVPVFLLGIVAGSVADRYPRRRIVLVTQANALLQATFLAVLTLSGHVRAWHLLPLAFMLGLTYAFEIPARQALLAEVAGEDMPNAIALNSSIVNGARVVGPGLAGLVVAAVGEGWCFALNAASFLATLTAVWRMEVPPRPPPVRSGREHLLEGLAYAARTPMVRALLATLALSAFFGMPYLSLLPVFAAEVLRGGPKLLGTLNAATGVGAFAGAVALLARKNLRGLSRVVAAGATVFGLGLLALGLSRSAPVTLAALVLIGSGFITQMAGTMTLLQALAAPEMRGRVMGVFSTLYVGITPFGALAGGVAAHRFGAPRTVLAGSLVVLIASAAFHLALPRLRRATQRAAGYAPAP